MSADSFSTNRDGMAESSLGRLNFVARIGRDTDRRSAAGSRPRRVRECHVLKITDLRNALADCAQPPSPPGVEALRHGYQYMSDNVLDKLEPVITPIRHALTGVGMTAADAVLLLRTAVKQVYRRMGLLASFMTKPAGGGATASGGGAPAA